MKRYIVLDKTFSIKGDGKEIYLFNISNGKRYLLNRYQFDILKNLDGNKTKEKILTKTTLKEKVIDGFIDNLERIKAIKYLDFKVRNPRKDIINLSNKPRLKGVHWEITSKCNLHCLHCYQASYLSKTKEITFKNIKNIIDDLVELGTENVSISGGEPLLKRDLLKILNYLENNNIRVSAIFTNGVLISKNLLNKLKLLKSNPTLNISLDGIRPDSMVLRGFKESVMQKKFLDTLIKNIKLARGKGFQVRINTILNKHNINSIEKMYDFLNKEIKGVFWSIGFPRALGSCIAHKTELLIGKKKMFDVCRGLIEKHRKYLLRNKANIDLKVQYLFHKKFLNSLNYYKLDSFICNYDDKNSMCCIKPNGDVLPCPVLLDFKIGNILKEKLSIIWQSNKMRKIKDMKIRNLTTCKKCKYLQLCGGGCRASAYVSYKNLYQRDPLACNTMLYFEHKIKPLLTNYAK